MLRLFNKKMFKKYILKYFNNKKYLDFKSSQKIEESSKIFKNNFENIINKIHTTIKEKKKLNHHNFSKIYNL